MTKAHTLTKLQLMFAILWLIPSCFVSSVAGSTQSALFLISTIPFTGLSAITIYLGWLMLVKKEDIIYPQESFALRFTEKTRGKQAADHLFAAYIKPSRKMLIGAMNILSGLGCLIVAIIVIVATLRGQ